MSKKLIITALSAIILILVTGFYFKKNTARFFYVIDCDVFDKDLEIFEKFHGTYCVFLKDGNYLSYHMDKIRKISFRGKFIWEKSYIASHTLISDRDEEFGLTLFDVVHDLNGTPTRFDKLVKFRISDGEIVKTWDSFDHKETLLNLVPWKYIKEEHPSRLKRSNGDLLPIFEFFHFNSINQIPPNNLEKKLSYLNSKNFIVSAGNSLGLIFNENLELVHTVLIDPMPYVFFHDVQVTPKGELLIYKNFISDTIKKSRIEVRDIQTQEIKWKFDKNKEMPMFFSDKLGSVQLLNNGSFLFSDITNGGRVMIVSEKGETEFDRYYPELDSSSLKPREFFKVKLVDLNSFYSKNL